MAKTKFYKLGKKASTFFDPVSKVNISNKGATSFSGVPSKKLQAAISGGHVVEISETEYNKLNETIFVHPKSETPAPSPKADADEDDEDEEIEVEDEDEDDEDEKPHKNQGKGKGKKK